MSLPSLEDAEDPVLPARYQIRTYRKGDEEFWVSIIKCSFGQNYPVNISEILDSQKFDPNAFFFLMYNDQPIGTVYAKCESTRGQRIGYIHMLGVIPSYHGRKLGRLLVLYALQYFKKRGFQSVILDTDDYRLPAIRTYLDLGFEPVFLEGSHRKRWKEVFAKIACARQPSKRPQQSPHKSPSAASSVEKTRGVGIE
jgi:mycothiol synthase